MEKYNRVKISSIVESQLPNFVRDEYPLVSELLTEYYKSLEIDGSSYDILQNIDQYVKVNNLTNLVEKTELINSVDFIDSIITVKSTDGFPQNHGLILIDNEVILYKSKTSTTFNDCVRGFSGITDYSVGNSEEFTFSSTEIDVHDSGSDVINLSSLFLKEFVNKTKKQFSYGFENRTLDSNVNENVFIKQSKDFYSSKGTDKSFEILFRVLYGKDVEILKPSQFLIKPSSAKYKVTRNFVVEQIQGNIEELANQTIFQDQYENVSKSFGTVTEVQRLIRGEKEYYVLMLDYDFDKDISVSGSIFGDLKTHAKTKVIDSVSVSSNTIIVDSTLGFQKSGELLIREENVDRIITYNGKTTNQFLNCSGIVNTIQSGVEILQNTSAYGYSNISNSIIKFRINGILSDFKLNGNELLYEENDIARVLTLGYNRDSVRDNNWIFNKTVKCEVKSFTYNGSFKYTIETFDDTGILSGDSVEVTYIDKSTKAKITSTIDGSKVNIPTGSTPGKRFQIQTPGYEVSDILYVKRLISKSFKNFLSDVSGVYKEEDLKSDSLYITSSSLPFYDSNKESDIVDYKITLKGIFSGETIKLVDSGNHGFLTGDAVVYYVEDSSKPNKLGINPGVYYIKKENNTEVKLSKSKYDIEKGKYIKLSETSISEDDKNVIVPFKFTNNNVLSEIDSQRLVRLLKNPINDSKKYETKPGIVGILVNGVEVLNYKSNDVVYYGSIKSADVISGGENYDIVKPPTLNISQSSSGLSTAKGYCGIEGSLKRIDVIDGGFDYLDVPSVTITGGGGFGAKAEAKMLSYEHSVDFNPSNTNKKIDLLSNIVGFSSYHKFRDGEPIIYVTNNNKSVGGLSTDAKYYAKVLDAFSITLHKTYEDSISGISSINITSYGSGNHKFVSTIRKLKINSINVIDSGTGYKSKKVSIPSSGINTATDTIRIYENPYSSGEVIYYYGGDSNIIGLSTGRYIVTKENDTDIKLSNVGSGKTDFHFYYKTRQYIDLKSNGSGNHIFDYEPISVKVEGRLGISTVTTNVDVNAKIQPVFRGNVTSAFIYDGGVGYGSSDIINYNKQPSYTLEVGSGARVTPSINNGKIIDIIINEKGKKYTSPPDLIIKGSGVGALLTPIINSDGELSEVKVINGGANYDPNNTTITVLSPGRGCELKFYSQKWNINNFEKLLNTNKISENDSVIYEGLNKNYGLQYSHLYSPRSLRKKIFSKTVDETGEKYKVDYQNDFDSEKYHSPLIGWAYDGNPIYGPYGYTSITNKKIKQIVSGYAKPVDNQENRPSKSIFPAGFFVEDYVFVGNGDLDECNGRYCVTPEFPQGTYAYFMTLDIEFIERGPFVNNKIPTFPYIIGNFYKSKPIDFNYNVTSNQDYFEFNNLVRNTNQNNTLNKNSEYEYFLNFDDLSEQKIRFKNTEKGRINSIKIISKGENYKVNDRLVFDNQGSGGLGAAAKVERISGKNISGISQTSFKIDNIEFYPSQFSNKIIGFSTIPHSLVNGSIVSINALKDYDSNLTGTFEIEVKKDNFILNLGVGNSSSTGIVTYFYVSGFLDYPNLRENDILKIGKEDVKVLNIDKDSSRIRVLRSQNSTISTSHSSNTILYEDPRKFYVNLGGEPTSKNYNINREIYFDPSESLGIGTIVGIGHTIIFSNPGVGVNSITIPPKSIYLKNHKLNTGDELLYKISPGGIGISVSYNGSNSFALSNNSIVYTAKISENLIGISTVRVGLGTTGEFVSIATSQPLSTLFFTSPGSGNYHSFVTKFDDVATGSVSKNTVIVSTASTHNLKIGDEIFIDSSIGTSNTITVLYNDYHRRLVINPRNFSSIDVQNNLIIVENHRLVTGDKLIHTSNSPASGLENQGIYYAVVYDKDKISLAKTLYDATNESEKNIVDITSSSSGTLSQINPKINILRNQTVIFDLSDQSLSESTVGSARTSSFEFSLFSDNSLLSNYTPVDSKGVSKLLQIGSIGIETSRFEFKIDDEFPNNLWYNLLPKSKLTIKKELVVDNEVLENNKLFFTKSVLNERKIITGITTQSFSFFGEFDSILQKNSLVQDTDGDFTYSTTSINEKGPIDKIKIVTGGISYERLPFISSITSSEGSGAILIPATNEIGKVNSYTFTDIGYDYPSDFTLKPIIKLPTILRLEPLNAIDNIQVITGGKNYITPPDLLLIDGFTNKVVDDIYLKYEIEDNFVTVVKNTTGLYNSTPRIIPINNSNGIGINSISYNNSNKIVTLFLNKQFSDINSFPFSINEKIFVEGISVGSGTSVRGYNSKEYDYSTFTITGIQTSTGGSKAYVQYSLYEFLKGNEIPGTFDKENSSGKAIPTKHFPVFKTTLKKNIFNSGEEVLVNDNKKGIVIRFDNKNDYLTLETRDNFEINNFIKGTSSKSQAIIKEVLSYDSFGKVGSSSVVKSGWTDEVGFLNNSLQRIQDSDYYQHLSYSIKSEISIDKWENVVSNLNHTLGFKKFSDLIIQSSPETMSGISTVQTEAFFTATTELNSIIDVDCIYDFDLVSENNFYINKTLTSDEIVFNSTILLDYSDSIGNRVLKLDDISNEFSNIISRTFITSFTI